jgi:hypothetical protein
MKKPWTTRDLIEYLQYIDPDLTTEVLVDGWEDGYTAINGIHVVEVVKVPEPRSWYSGEYDNAPSDPTPPADERLRKIVIGR